MDTKLSVKRVLKIPTLVLFVISFSEFVSACQMNVINVGRELLTDYKPSESKKEQDNMRKLNNRYGIDPKEFEKRKRYLPEVARELIQDSEEGFHFFTYETGCYETEHSSQYRGKMFMTHRARKCKNWNLFLKFLLVHINDTMDKLKENRWRIFTLERDEDDIMLEAQLALNLELANQTIAEFDKHGIADHNFCRDPDNIGKPWCFVDMKDLKWEYCAVPKCTPCWKMRQRSMARKAAIFYLGREHRWIPRCTTYGDFEKIQCWEDHCWCSHKNGNMVPNSLRKSSRDDMKCGGVLNSTIVNE